jgi:hypothetical protein
MAINFTLTIIAPMMRAIHRLQLLFYDYALSSENVIVAELRQA